MSCPRCGSQNTVIWKSGFSPSKKSLAFGLIGAAVSGVINANKVEAICQDCGHKWRVQ